MARGEFSVNISVEENGRRKPQYTLDSDLNGEMTLVDLLNWTRQALIVTADEALQDEKRLGFDDEPIMLVDGRRGRDIRTVSPLGQIEFVSRQDAGGVLLEAYDGLLKRSKVLKGDYKKSHFVFYNGKQVATDFASLQAWVGFVSLGQSIDFKDGDTVRIVNIQPYARRLERLGVTAQRTSSKRKIGPLNKGARSPSIDNGAYQLTTRAIKAKYKQNALVKFEYLPGSCLGLTGSFKKGRKGKNSSGRPYLYPSIKFTIQERGIT